VAVTWKKLAYHDEVANKTTAAWSKSIGATGDYATWVAMITDMPDLIAHAVTVTIEDGTTLTEICELRNKHGLTSAAIITIQAEKYFPVSGALPTADSATATTLRDAALASAALGNDYFNGSWVLVVDGTGTDNGFVLITDYIDATGDVVVAAWPGTQPDNTSRYQIVGALIDCAGTRSYGLYCSTNTITVYLYGIGITNGDLYNLFVYSCSLMSVKWCGFDKSDRTGIYGVNGNRLAIDYCGLVGNNTDNSNSFGGIRFESMLFAQASYCGLSDNSRRGVLVVRGGYARISNNFGDNNGLWGTYAQESGQADCSGTECSGSSGNHSNAVGDGSLAY